MEQSSKKLTINIAGTNGEYLQMNVSTVKSLDLPMQTIDYSKLSQQFGHLKNLPIESFANAVP